ncbi:MAG: hypothetical protein LBV71_06455 [Prevotella sp.]|jgi:hypothetical protein|nr:hypothetical protein [Prevotella sp.]
MSIFNYLKNLFGKDNDNISDNKRFKFFGIFNVVAFKHSGKSAFIPENLDIDEHIEKYPLVNYRFYLSDNGKLKAKGSNIYYDKDRLLYVISLITIIPAHNKNNIFEDDYVPINSTLIRDFILKDYKNYLDYLIDTGVIECDNHYIKNEKSYGYRFTEKYADVPLKIILYKGHINKETETIPSSIFNDEGIEIDNPLLNYPYLRYWYAQKGLNIDINKALKFASDYTEKKIKDGYNTWKNSKTKKGDKIHPKTQKRAIQFNLYSLSTHDYNAKIDTNVHRLHSAMTNMESVYRNFITFEGRRLVNLDIKNSQPYLACILFSPQFWDNTSTQFNYTHLPTNIQTLINNTIINNTPLHKILKDYTNNITNTQEINSYKRKVSEGNFYEYMIDQIKKESGREIDRQKVKDMMFEVFFSKNQYLNQPMYKHKKMFSKIHPNVYEVFRLIKSTDHATLACLLQSIESEIVLHRCCKRVWEEGNQEIPIFTIHDSIVTTVENLNFVKNIMEEELTNTIGVPPKLETDYWNYKEALMKL